MKYTHYYRLLTAILVVFLNVSLGFSQGGTDRFVEIEAKLVELAKTNPGLNETVDLSFNNTSIQDFVKTLASATSINVSVDPGLPVKITNDFSNVSTINVLMFLCKKYNLDVNFIGNIITISAYVPPAIQPKEYAPKDIKVSFDASLNVISMDLSNDSLQDVTKKITLVSKKNVIYSPELSNKLVSVFIQKMPFDNALDKLAFANDLKVTVTEDNVYLIEKKEKEVVPSNSNGSGRALYSSKKGNSGGSGNVQGLTYKVQDGVIVNITADNVPISDILFAVANELKVNFFLFSEIKGNASLTITNAGFSDFLTKLFNGTEFTFKEEEGVYLIGNRTLEGLRATKLYKFKYRTAEKLADVIPADIKKGVDIKPFPDLNALILSGSQPAIAEVESFFRQIDKVVPVIMIEVMMVDVRNTKTLSTKLDAGLTKGGKTTSGTTFPSLNMDLSANTINEIITGINGFGLLNLGNVTSNFYLTIQALEAQGILKTRSTPKLSTLNGHEAKLTNSRTEYYLEIANNVIGSQNPQNIISQQYKSVNADFSLSVNPTVSGDEYITLEVKVKQSNFTERISQNAPPGTISRDFQSMIRVKNQELVLLGGLEENSTNDSGSGVPFLSRIPVLKWFFSSRTRSKSNSKLTIFIKPTVFY